MDRENQIFSNLNLHNEVHIYVNTLTNLIAKQKTELIIKLSPNLKQKEQKKKKKTNPADPHLRL